MHKRTASVLFIVVAAVLCALLTGCPAPVTPPDDPDPEPNPIPTELDKYGSISLSRETLDGVAAEQYYVMGSIDGTNVLYRFTNTGGQVSAKNVVCGSTAITPSEDPDVLTIGGVEHLLFAGGKGYFALWAKSSEDDTTVNFVQTSIYDFTAITTYVQSLLYKGYNQAWVSSPEYNEAHKTLYFTLAQWVSDSSGDYFTARVFKSVLTSQAFGTPVEVHDELNPLDGIHYADGQDRVPSSTNRWLIGRLYMNDAGTRAYFSVLNMVYPGGLVEGDAFSAPIPNEASHSGFDDMYHPGLIRSYICSTDVAPDGTFSNVEQFTPIVQGLNMVSDISADGNTLCVVHMEVDEDYWAYTPMLDGFLRELCILPSVFQEEWRGYFLTYAYSGGIWTQTGTVGEEVKSIHSAAYLENQAKFLAFDEDAFRTTSPWIPASTTMNPTFEHGMFWYNLSDYVNYFADGLEAPDPTVLGAWVACGFVQEKENFNPAATQGGLFWTGVNFIEANLAIQIGYNGGALGAEQQHMWTSGKVLSAVGYGLYVAQGYEVQTIDSVSYLFVEWKSGDYFLRGSKPCYYVFKRP